jgi:hypothetical protein
MIHKFSAVLFFIFFGINNYAMLMSPHKSVEDKIVLTSSDNKKLEKAEKEAQRSKQLLQDAEKQYADIAAKQADMTSEETEKLNSKALAKQIEALKAVQSSDKMKYEVYTAKADEFWKKFQGNPEDLSYAKSLESNARISFQSAQDQYKSADKMKDKLMCYSSMTSASDLSNKSVEDIKKAFDIYAATSFTQAPISQSVTQPKTSDSIAPKADTTKVPVAVVNQPKDNSSSNIYTALKVNDDMKDKFNIFLRKTYPNDYDKYIADFSSLNNSDVEGINNAWQKYLSGEENQVTTSTTNTTLPQLKDTTKIPVSNTQVFQSSENKEKTMDQEQFQQKRIKRSAEDYVQKSSDATEAKGFTYTVQIAASRVPLTSESLKAVYAGPEKTQETHENEWYKYTVGSFSSLASAIQFKESCQVKDAFVVANLDGKNIIFKVQIAACRNEMQTEDLKKIYNGAEALESSQEDGWYKYLINCGNNYYSACDLLKNILIEGAFIAAYRDGQRIELKSVFSQNN